MKKDISKSQAEKKIENFFSDAKSKSSKEVRKIKRFAMAYNIPLREKRKLFCKKCLSPYKNSKIRIKNKIKSVECENCGTMGRWKME